MSMSKTRLSSRAHLPGGAELNPLVGQSRPVIYRHSCSGYLRLCASTRTAACRLKPSMSEHRGWRAIALRRVNTFCPVRGPKAMRQVMAAACSGRRVRVSSLPSPGSVSARSANQLKVCTWQADQQAPQLRGCILMFIQRRNLLALGVLTLAGCGGSGGDGSGLPDPAMVAAQTTTADTALYRVTLRNHWTAAAFSTRFPAAAHLTGVVGATHGAGVDFWALGQPASPGIKDVAERGRKTPLLDEVANAISAGTAEFALSGDGVALGVPEVALLFNISTRFPRVTLVSMLGPSPDWFTGVGGVSLLQGGQWLQSLEMPLRVYDAGTDDGTTFTSPNAVSSPATPVQPLSTDVGDSDLLNGVHSITGQALASILFERLA